MLSETEYRARSERELKLLLGALDSLGDELEVELASDILTIEFRDGSRFVVNSHRAARQIWMAAGTEAWHFDPLTDERWVAHKNGDELWSSLSRVVGAKLGRALQLRPGR